MMFASFHSTGTTPSFNDKLNTLASGILICCTVFISSFGGIFQSFATEQNMSCNGKSKATYVLLCIYISII